MDMDKVIYEHAERMANANETELRQMAALLLVSLHQGAALTAITFNELRSRGAHIPARAAGLHQLMHMLAQAGPKPLGITLGPGQLSIRDACDALLNGEAPAERKRPTRKPEIEVTPPPPKQTGNVVSLFPGAIH